MKKKKKKKKLRMLDDFAFRKEGRGENRKKSCIHVAWGLCGEHEVYLLRVSDREREKEREEEKKRKKEKERERERKRENKKDG